MKKSATRLVNFLRKNALYLILAFCVLAVGLSATYMIVKDLGGGDITVDVPIDPSEDDKVEEPTIIMFSMPVEKPSSVEVYADTMVWCSTLNRYTAHVGIDYLAPEGTPVLAAYKGVVESVETDLIKGVTIVLDHGNGLKTFYNSLADGDLVKVGQTVNAGDTIGAVSVTNRTEYKKGAHLHFEVTEDGENVDPEKYFYQDIK